MPIGIGRWKAVERRLLAEIENGVFAPGEQLPTDVALSQRFGVGRHSVRRAVQALADTGALRVRQGAGTFVADQAMLSYAIGSRTRFRQNLSNQGLTASSNLLEASVVPATPKVAAMLSLQEGEPVHHTHAVGKADDVPISLSRAWFPAERFADLGVRRAKGHSVSAIYADHGIEDYRRLETTLHARLARADEARLLDMGEGHPVVVVTKTDVDLDGYPIGHAKVLWVASRVQFTFGSEGAAGTWESTS